MPLLGLAVYVSGQSVDLHVGVEQPYASIKAALDAAHPGDRITVHSGHYAEGNLVISKPLYLRGLDYPVVDGMYESEIFTIVSDSVTIEGFKIQHVGVSMVKDRAAIKVEASDFCVIRNNHLEDTFFGVYLAKSKDCLVAGNKIIGQAKEEATSGNAIHLWYCKRIEVRDNECAYHRDGVYIEFSEESVFSRNFSHHNIRYGLHFMFSDKNEYRHNRFQNNSAGVAVMYSHQIIMESNQFMDNWGAASYGLLLKEIKDSQLSKNVFSGNTIGIYAEGSNRVSVSNNTFESNGWAVKIMGNCEANVFSHNNFISNTFDFSTNGRNSLGNSFDENYWSEYSGYDLNRDGFGDVPYKPVNLFSFVVENNPSATILLRSLFVDILNLAEKVTPVLTPETFDDARPLMKMAVW